MPLSNSGSALGSLQTHTTIKTIKTQNTRQELLGYCVELYQSNRAGTAALVAHLTRYGYEAPPGAAQQPADPCCGPGSCCGGGEEYCFEDGEWGGAADARL